MELEIHLLQIQASFLGSHASSERNPLKFHIIFKPAFLAAKKAILKHQGKLHRGLGRKLYCTCSKACKK